MPLYRSFPSTPYTGNLPPNREMGPPDLFPSSNVAPAYQRRFDKMFGRHLAGDEEAVVIPETKSPGDPDEPAYALNELRYFAEMDDTQGSGIFEPPGSAPNNYPDAGIFAQSFSSPGYLAREKPWQKSEVVDGTTGRPVTYVPGGAVAMDSAAQVAFVEDLMYQAPNPLMTPYQQRDVPDGSTVNVRQNPIPITAKAAPAMVAGYRGYGADAAPVPAPAPASPLKGVLIAAGLAGLAVGIVYATSKKKQHTPNKRRR